MDDKCPACGTAYVDHLGLIGTCKELQEALEEFAIVSRTSNEYMVQNAILREALERIKNRDCICDSCAEMNMIDARQALQRAGGDK